MKKIFSIVFTITIALTTQAQDIAFDWSKSIGGTSADSGTSIGVDASGNVYTTGYFQGTVDFDPNPGTTNLTSIGVRDIFVQKMDASGNFLWAKSFGGISNDYVNSIRVDTAGNVYTTGSFEGTVDFDPGTGTVNLTSLGNSDIFVQKMDASGNFLWAKSLGGNSYDGGYAINIDALGNVYITGSFSGTVDFDPGLGTTNLTAAGISDIFVQKMDASGNFLWAKSFGGTRPERGLSISVDSTGNVYTTGYFEGTADFDPGVGLTNLTSVGGGDIFVQKMDSSGNFLWAKSFGSGSSTYDYGHSISVDTAGNVYTSGIFQGTVDFDPGAGTTNLISAGETDVFVLKMDASGNFLWAKAIGSADLDVGYAISLDTSGNIYTTGYFKGNVDFDPGAGITNLTSLGIGDVFVQKMDVSGNFLWAKSFGSTSHDNGWSIIVDTAENVYIAGDFQGTVDFDPGVGATNLTSAGSYDIFIHKMSLQPILGTEIANQINFSVYPNPTTNHINFAVQANAQLNNISGQVVANKTNTNSLDLTDLPTGVYFLTLTGDNGQVLQRNKIVKE